MGGWSPLTVIRGVVNAIFRPRYFVAAQTSAYSTSRLSQVRQVIRLTTVYLVNLATYAGPLTLAGFGVASTVGSPPGLVRSIGTAIGDPTTLWQLTLGFIQNSSFITALAAVTFVTYHGGIALTRNSAGIVQSLHTVVYSTSAYLAGLFTVVWYLSTASGLEAARSFVLNIQLAGVYAITDLVGSELALPQDRPTTLLTQELSQTGTVVLGILVVLLLYYFYSLYLGARLNHRMSRSSSILAVFAVGLAPALYIIASIVATTAQFGV